MSRFLGRHLCPDCGRPLLKGTEKNRYHCENSECLMIFVVLSRGRARNRIIRIARAAEARRT